MHNTFVHRADNTVVVNGVPFPVGVLQAFDPGYSLPVGIKSVRYTHDTETETGYHFLHDGFRNISAAWPAPTLDRYIANLSALQAIHESVQQENAEIDQFIQDLATTYADKRKQEYPDSTELVVAMWELLVEGNTEGVQKLQQRRLHTKSKFPKPSE